jgi:hypothetical protein
LTSHSDAPSVGKSGGKSVAPFPEAAKLPIPRLPESVPGAHSPPAPTFPMGSLKKRRKTKINKHKRKKRLRKNRHKKRLRYKS